MPRPLHPPLPVDESLVAADDNLLAMGSIALAIALNGWFESMRLTYRQIEALCALACGRSRIPPATITRIRRVAVNPSEQFNPQASTLLALGRMNRYVDDLAAKRRRAHPLFDDALGRMRPLLRADGGLLTEGDMAQILVGVQGILEPIAPPMRDIGPLQNLAEVLGLVIERAMFDAGRSPLRDLGALLMLYPIPEERKLLRAVISGDAILTATQMNEMLPGLAYALSRFTGQTWDRDRLLEAALPLRPVDQ